MKRALIFMLFLPAISFAGTHVQEGSSFVAGQCVQASTGDAVSTTGSACGSGASVIINNANQYSDAYYSASGASNTISGLTPDSSKLNQMVFWNSGVPSFGDAPGFAMVDNTAFTIGTSSFNPVGGVYNDTTTALGVGAAAGARITPFRALEVNLRDNAGVVVGTGPTSPIYIYQSNPSTVTVSGTVTTSTHVITDAGSIVQANAGTNLNTSALALESGGNLATLAGGVSGSKYQVNVASWAGAALSTSNPIPTHDTGTVTVTGTVTANEGGAPWSTTVSTLNVSGSPVSTSNPVPTHDTGTVTITGSISNTGFNVNNTPSVNVSSWGATPAALSTSNPLPTHDTGTVTVSVTGTVTTATSNSTTTIQGIAQTTALPTASSAGAQTPVFTDKFGRIMVTGIPREQIKQATATLTSGTETVLISSGAAGVFNDLCGCVFSNTSGTAVRIDLRGQGNGGTINHNFELPATDTRGFWPGCQNPFVQLSSASNWTVQLSGSVTDVRVTCQYIPIK